MVGGKLAVCNGDELAKEVCAVGEKLDLEVREQFKVGRRIWRAERRIDVIFIHKTTRKTLGIECKYQGSGGSAEEKIPTTIQDIEAWPIPGVVVFAGKGFSQNIKSYLISTGKAVELTDFESWVKLFFGLELD